jgi:hypothetical protein
MPCVLSNPIKTVAKNHAAPQNLFGDYFSLEADCPVRISSFQPAELAKSFPQVTTFPSSSAKASENDMLHYPIRVDIQTV